MTGRDKWLLHAARALNNTISELPEPNAVRISTTSVKEPGSENYSEVFDLCVSDEVLRQYTRALFLDGHYARAVEEAYKCVNNAVKTRINSQADGTHLMESAFSPGNPKLKLNRLRSQSDRDEQHGYMRLFSGSMLGIRNPRAHEHELQDHPEIAIELLIFANHLLRKLNGAVRARARHPKAKA